MAQTSMTVRLDNKQKAIFDELCAQFGMSANTAINIFVKAVIRSKSIPFPIQAGENGAFPPTRNGCIHSLSMRERG